MYIPYTYTVNIYTVYIIYKEATWKSCRPGERKKPTTRKRSTVFQHGLESFPIMGYILYISISRLHINTIYSSLIT